MGVSYGDIFSNHPQPLSIHSYAPLLSVRWTELTNIFTGRCVRRMMMILSNVGVGTQVHAV